MPFSAFSKASLCALCVKIFHLEGERELPTSA
jgi:hypothetical protein